MHEDVKFDSRHNSFADSCRLVFRSDARYFVHQDTISKHGSISIPKRHQGFQFRGLDSTIFCLHQHLFRNPPIFDSRNTARKFYIRKFHSIFTISERYFVGKISSNSESPVLQVHEEVHPLFLSHSPHSLSSSLLLLVVVLVV